MTMEIMAMMKVFIWLESQDYYTHVCISSDSLRIIRRIETDTVLQKWFVALRTLLSSFLQTRGLKETDRLADITVIKDGQA
jgi:hypothetical protein